ICTLIYRRIGLLKRDQAQYITGDEKNERARKCTKSCIFPHLRPFSSTPPPLKHRFAGVLVEVTCTLSARNSAPPPHHSQITTQTTHSLLIDQTKTIIVKTKE